jgi:hypothetical protein
MPDIFYSAPVFGFSTVRPSECRLRWFSLCVPRLRKALEIKRKIGKGLRDLDFSIDDPLLGQDYDLQA